MGDNVSDDDGTKQDAPHLANLHYTALPCPTLPYPALPCLALLCLSVSVLLRE